MALTQSEFTQFQQFALGKLANGEAESIDHLADLWRLEHPTPEQEAEDIAAIHRGLADAEAGRIVTVGEAFAEARRLVSERS